MKKLLTLASALVALAVLTDLSVAQQKDTQKSAPKSVETKPAPTKPPAAETATTAKGSKGDSSDNKASAKPMTGELTAKVTGVDSMAKTFTVMFQERAITFSAAKLGKLPTVGKTIDIAFTAKSGELPMATASTESGSNAGAERVKKKYQHCVWMYPSNPLMTLNVCTY